MACGALAKNDGGAAGQRDWWSMLSEAIQAAGDVQRGSTQLAGGGWVGEQAGRLLAGRTSFLSAMAS